MGSNGTKVALNQRRITLSTKMERKRSFRSRNCLYFRTKIIRIIPEFYSLLEEGCNLLYSAKRSLVEH
jgi:hypothetical protein